MAADLPAHYKSVMIVDPLLGARCVELVEPAANIESAGTTRPPASHRIFAYPKHRQSAQQEASDATTAITQPSSRPVTGMRPCSVR